MAILKLKWSVLGWCHQLWSHPDWGELNTGTGLDLIPNGEDEVQVGFGNTSNSDGHWNDNWRGLVRFDMGIVPRSFLNATLRFHINKAAYSINDATSNTLRTSPLRWLWLASVDWWKGNSDIFVGGTADAAMPVWGIDIPTGDYQSTDGRVSLRIGDQDNDFRIDVTDVARAWRDKTKPNNGFVLAGYHEPSDEDNNNAVQAAYHGFQLELEYAPVAKAASDIACYRGPEWGHGERVRCPIYRGTDGKLYQLWCVLEDHVKDARWRYRCISHDASIATPVGGPTAYALPDGTGYVVYRSPDGRLHRTCNKDGKWQDSEDLTAASGAPDAVGDPFGYMLPDDTQCVVYRGKGNALYRVWLPASASTWHHEEITAGVAGDPMAYLLKDGSQCVVYRGIDNHIHRLWLSPANNKWWPEDLTAHAAGHMSGRMGAPQAADDPFGYVLHDGTQRVVYRTVDGSIGQLIGGAAGMPALIEIPGSANPWRYLNLTKEAQAQGVSAKAAGKPTACVTKAGGQDVVYRSVNNHLYQLFADMPTGYKWTFNDVAVGTYGGKGGPKGIIGNPTLYLDEMERVLCRGESEGEPWESPTQMTTETGAPGTWKWVNIQSEALPWE